jgi:indolepyruvate ferredoxin oxidoreductase alpha subunit
LNRIISKQPGEKDILLGNEAIARGVVEAGVKVAAAYPGTPSSEIMETLLEVNKEMGFYAEWSINEKVAFEMTAGAALTGARSFTAMKGAGLNVIMDMFLTLPYTGVRGGFVMVVADDPGAHYSSNEQDSRIAAQWANILCLEPEDQEQAREMTRAAFLLSEELEQPVMLRIVTRLAHSSGIVQFSEIDHGEQQTGFNKHYAVPYRWNVYGPPGAVIKHDWQLERRPAMQAMADDSPFNELIKGKTKIGVVASGMGAAYVREAFRALELVGNIWFLKLGMVFPVPGPSCMEILEQCEKVLVVEEGDAFIETQLRVLAQSNGLDTEILGKSGAAEIPSSGELNTLIVKKTLAKLVGRAFSESEERRRIKAEVSQLVIPRSSNLCAGCPHLGTYWALMQETQKDRKAIPIINGDIGCYEQAGYGVKGQMPRPSLDLTARYPTRTPYNFLDTLYVMGSGISMAQGETRSGYKNGPVVAVAGDSTFFHTCMPGLLNAVWNKTKVTFVVMDNSWTAMTGHQVCPATGINPSGSIAKKVLIEDVARSMGVESIQVTDPYNVPLTCMAIQCAMDYDGPSLVIARGECVLQVLRREGNKPTKTHVTEDCTGCKICVQVGCPAISYKDKKAVIDPILCVDCGICSQVCPHEAIVEGNVA